MASELKPCPHCGGKATYDKSDGTWFIHCSTQDCIAGWFSPTRSKAQVRESWNRRVPVKPETRGKK